VLTLGLDLVLLEHRVKGLLLTRRLDGFVMRSECVTEEEEKTTLVTIIVFEALLKEGPRISEALFESIKAMPFVRNEFPANYEYLSDLVTSEKWIEGVAIAESKVSPKHSRVDSSGGVYSHSLRSALETRLKSARQAGNYIVDYAYPATLSALNMLSDGKPGTSYIPC
jgi:hypothetical protein